MNGAIAFDPTELQLFFLNVLQKPYLPNVNKYNGSINHGKVACRPVKGRRKHVPAIVKVNHSGIAVLLPDNIWDGNTVDPYVKST